MTREFTFDVFLSHRHADKPRVRQIAQRLRDAGLRVWLDEWIIKPGDDIYLTIENGLEQARTLVLCLSKSAIESDWVGLERSTALFRDPGNRDRRFVPVLLEDTPLPDTIRRYRYIDYRQDNDAVFSQLLVACTGSALPQPSPTDQAIVEKPRSDVRQQAAQRSLNGPQVTAIGKPPIDHLKANRITPLLVVAAGAFTAALLILVLMLDSAETLVRLGLAGNLYYLVLVPLGLAVAAFLFGVLKSYAVYAGRVAGGTLELGGPIVGFLLVLILGFVLVPNPSAFSLTVFVHGEKGKQDLVLRNRGAVLLDLGGNRRSEAIGDKGQAYFPGIPANFRGQLVRLSLDSEGFEPATNDQLRLDSESVYLAIRPKAVRLVGYVKADGEPVNGARVTVADQKAQTDDRGYFRLTLSGQTTTENAILQVSASGYKTWIGLVAPGGNEIIVQLEKK